MAKIFVHPLAVLIFDNLSSKPHPTAAISPLNLHPAAITPTSFPLLTNPRPLCLYHVCVFLFHLSSPSQNSEFLRIHLFPSLHCQSSLSSGVAFMKCIPHPFAFYSISPTGQILSVNDSSARSASLIIDFTHIYLFLQQVPESRGFSSVPCHLKHSHYQPLHNDMAATLCCN